MMSFQSDHNFPAVGRRHIVVFISLLIKICGKEGNTLLPRSLFRQLKLFIWQFVPKWGEAEGMMGESGCMHGL